MITASEAIERLGGAAKAAEALQLKRTTVAMWRQRQAVPPKHAMRVAAALRVDVQVLLPNTDVQRRGEREARAA